MFLARRECSELEEKKRTKFQIYLDILEALSEELKSEPNPQPSKIAHKANLPYDRFRSYFDYLVQLGLISSNPGTKLAITERGEEYIREVRRHNEFLRKMKLIE
jgi:predicted transcriptional regulator